MYFIISNYNEKTVHGGADGFLIAYVYIFTGEYGIRRILYVKRLLAHNKR